ncbi:N-acetyl-alpha-D-glucosaminyl L-malate synthase BshA [Chlorobium sp. BLA1]|uniref:N-acetyl-alpha-D-glucosaminyl L-malate synthase BshA n=1 Tax=Candidatus Chlorobium masyuteum TaxID=2716876 RepID=UPI001420DD0B|nr:N-acetyl-alpha-D-glucosaminyl L-malate synthase BshA [Candidatus Chlorobium masyuteum]NHQ60693.1 N-acetyl-alpha-D-glucosaminyl L-malate synthase BshA [Candidatus Chlorobium masyuteum]NTU45938.1 N-acetyl-alpha-D-glucosaminyl L-malate synthase BshA [Chlorobiaceae bacterium]
MKIGILCHPTYGGSGAIAAELGKALAAKGHTIHFFSQSLPFRLGTFSKNIFYHEVEEMHYPLFENSFYPLALASKIAQVARFENLDVVHAHYAIPHAMSAMLARQMLEDKCSSSKCFRLATTLHGTDITVVGADRGMQDVVRLAINKSDGVTAVSGYLRDETVRMFSPKREVTVISNFVDTSYFFRSPRAELREQLGIGDEKIVIHISNFRPVKCIGDIIRIFHGVSRQIDATLLLVGDGPERSGAEELVRQFGINDRVRFLGKLDDIVPLLSMADLMLMPSNAESFGLAALEAMACGVPVVATMAGGFPEFILPGRHGYLLAPGDIAAMTEKSLLLLTDSTHWLECSEACVAQAKRYETARLVEEYERYYIKLIEETPL